MTAISFRRTASPSPAAPGDGILAGCLIYAAAAPASAGDPELMLEALRRLERSLVVWRAGQLDRRDGRAPPPLLSLGDFAREFAAWVAARGGRRDEPPEWLMRECLEAIAPTPQPAQAAAAQARRSA